MRVAGHDILLIRYVVQAREEAHVLVIAISTGNIYDKKGIGSSESGVDRKTGLDRNKHVTDGYLMNKKFSEMKIQELL